MVPVKAHLFNDDVLKRRTGSEYMSKGFKLRRGYSIPLFDLDEEVSKQVVVHQEPGQYLGHVTTVLLDDGCTMIAVYPKGHGRGAIVMKKSFDGGLTWTNPLSTPPNWASSQEVPTIYKTTDPQGKNRLILFSGIYPIRMSVSEDEGHTWSELEPIGKFGGIVAMSDLVKLPPKGHYLAFFHDDNRLLEKGEGGQDKFPKTDDPYMRIYGVVSTDGGLSWSLPRVLVDHPQAHLCEAGVVMSPDGREMAILLRENSRVFNSFVSFSRDYGQTWSNPRELPGALTGDRHVARYLPDGRLIVVFRDTAHLSPTWGDFAAWVGRYEDIVQGREGQYRMRLKKNHKDADTAYAGVEVLPDGTIAATTYGHWIKGETPYILSVRFKINEIDQRLHAALTKSF